MTYKRVMLLSFVSVAIAACTVGPDYDTPAVPLPKTWDSSKTAEKSAALPQKGIIIEREWWKQFHDPVLDQLIAKALENNLDLAIAQARITEVRAMMVSARSALLPSVNLAGNATREANRFAIPGNLPGLTKPFNVFETGFDATWELDVFGGKRRELESAKAMLTASHFSREEVRVSMLAEVARHYVDIRHYQAQRHIALAMTRAEKHRLIIANQLFDTGKIAGYELEKIKAKQQEIEATLPYYDNLLAQSEYSMDVLLSALPGTTHKMVEKEASIPIVQKQLLETAPLSVVRSRPDIVAAERKLAAATAGQGVAMAERYPDISLSGFFGVLGTDSSSVFTRANKSWQGGGNFLFPLLNYGRVSSDIEAAIARKKEARATYLQTIMGALADVERAYTAYNTQEKNRMIRAEALKDHQKMAHIAALRYKEGLTSYLEVLDAEQARYNAESQSVEANARASESLVALYKSVGGGWQGGM